MSGLQVMGGRVLVQPLEDRPVVSESGIELVDSTVPTHGLGRVVGVGTKHRCPECDTPMPIELRVGAIVGFPYVAGQDVTMNGEPFVILNLDHVQFEWTPDTAQESA